MSWELASEFHTLHLVGARSSQEVEMWEFAKERIYVMEIQSFAIYLSALLAYVLFSYTNEVEKNNH